MSTSTRETPRAWPVALVFALLIGAAFPDALVGGQAFFYRDYGVVAYPTVFYHRQSFWHGELPLWNPLSNCGAPFLAQWGTMTLYPGALFYLLLPLPWSLGVFCLAHLWLAAFGMFWLARRWTGNAFAGALAGVVFGFNGVTLSCLLWPNYLVALGWMPWLAVLAEEAWTAGGRRLLLAGLVAALQLLAGVPELVLLTWLFLGVQALGMLFRGSVPAGRLVVRWLGVLALALGLTAAQTLPFLDLLAHSQRDAAFATAKWALPLWGWVNFLAPLFHCFPTTQGPFFQHGQEFFSSTYLGLWPLALAGWVSVRALRARTRRVLPLAALALLGVALALGESGPIYRGLRALLPVAGLARYPVKFILLTSFVLPLLVAAGGAAWRGLQEAHERVEAPQNRGVPRGAWRTLGLWLGVVLTIVGAAVWIAYRQPFEMEQWRVVLRNALARVGFLAWAVLAWWGLHCAARARLQSVCGWALLAIVWLDYQTSVPRQNPTVPAACFRPGLTEFAPPPRPGDGRVFIAPAAEDVLLRSRVGDVAKDFIGKRLALWSNLNLLEGIAKVNGSATLQLREQAQVQALFYGPAARALPRLADFLGARWATSPANVLEWAPRPSAAPLVTAGQQPIFAPAAAALAAIAGSDFNGQTTVYLPPEARAGNSPARGVGAQVAGLQFGAQRIEFDVAADAPAWVVIAQSYYHPWRATVDAQPSRLWRANHAFQALAAPAGRHHVVLVYADRGWVTGVAISVATALVALGLWRQRPPRDFHESGLDGSRHVA